MQTLDRSPARALPNPLLAVSDLTIGFPDDQGQLKQVTQSVGFTLNAGESLAVVGESGSGKTLVGRALLGLLPERAQIVSGSIRFDGREWLDNTPAQWLAARGTEIGMVFQEPMVSLNPAARIGDQLTEALIRRRRLGRDEARELAVRMLERVRVRDPRGCLKRYPHEFSGGMRQRILLAAVMLLRPRLLIADEPTTALDCVVQKEVLDLLLELTREEGTALIFISHNLALVTAYTERVLVMRRGVVVETGAVANVLARPSHDYTLSLLEALPRRAEADADAAVQAEEPGMPAAPPVIEVNDVAIDYTVPGTWFRSQTSRAVHPSSLSVRAGETVAIVGESGSGKTSLAKAILGLAPIAQGQILLNGKPFLYAGRDAMQAARRSVQMVFQDPYSSLDPRMRVDALVREGLRLDTTLDVKARQQRVATALADVGLEQFGSRLVHQLSGGQRQRVAIARALASRPAVIIADEPVSALDVTVQKQILDMLVSLQKRYHFACLLISHDLGVVEQIADRVVVMFRGHIVEEGSRDAVFDNPSHPYTRRLLQAVPELRGNRTDGFKVITRAVPEDPDPRRAYFDATQTSAVAPVLIDVMPPVFAHHRIAIESPS
ncbi:dipeptide ABC transporter ATP-binding protein [Paraburkholderia strydomiana]|uniref:dipeptide ABC transporter ATP-binding protein n=1 Tax=Paraburkholderia strydomiana TaxID=1245417 RepID=UPI001BE8E244|nr:ABC transporter ATP-binding protein [Paraburkholderia strydomiana]MBT2790128.1 ABC transporter ATP-binding protein [Paraburkholderia strydomiana]